MFIDSRAAEKISRKPARKNWGREKQKKRERENNRDQRQPTVQN